MRLLFKDILNPPRDFATDGSQFDALLEPGSSYEAGSLKFDLIPTPGHTPACVTLKFGDAIVTGDVFFMPDMGPGRCDFTGGSAEDLYDSAMRLYGLPADTRVDVGHDDQPGGRELRYVSPTKEHREANVALPASRGREDFVQRRPSLDAGLEAPQLRFQSVQVNVDAGTLPEPDANEIACLRIPINVFRLNKKGEWKLEDV